MIREDARLKRALLWVPAKLYDLIVRLRVVAHETGYLHARRFDAAVISIGNITVGGTGKTPFVEYVARYLSGEGYRVAILTRGYGRKSAGRRVLNSPADNAFIDSTAFGAAEFGDEPLMLARSLPDVPVVIDKKRGDGARWAIENHGADVLVLDDGYQHLGVARDLNILLLDATDPFGGFEMVPFGRLREPLYGLKRADAVIVTRADRPFDQGQVTSIIRKCCDARVPVLYFTSSITGLRHLETGDVYDAGQFGGWQASLVCGIGNPKAFAEDVVRAGISVLGEDFFPDHHAFTQSDLDRVTRNARAAGADLIITTEKDAVRMEGLKFGEVPVYAARLELQSDDEVRLKRLLLRTVILKKTG